MMKTKPILFSSFVAVLCGYLVYTQSIRTGQPGIVTVGDRAPDFSIKDEDGRKVKLSDFKGKVVFLNFWATWCAPCVDEAPEIEQIHRAFKNDQFQMLAISSDTSWAAVRNFQKEHGLAFPVLLDPGQVISRYIYKTTGLPETFVIDANGVIVKHTFAAHWADPQLVMQIQALIQNAEISSDSRQRFPGSASMRY